MRLPPCRAGRGTVAALLFRLLATLLLGWTAAVPARAADPDALWKIVHGACVPDEAEHAYPAPCAKVSLDAGWAVLKDRRGETQYLLIPTARVTGIEDPAVLGGDAPNYWAAAWAARRFVFASAGRVLPRDAVSLAVNSPSGRSQNQLHIHVECLRPDVRDALRQAAPTLGDAWTRLPGGLRGHAYMARRLDGATLGEANPFRLLAAAPQVGTSGIGDWTLVVAGARFAGDAPGFVLLADRIDRMALDRAEGEELQDHDCALAGSLPN